MTPFHPIAGLHNKDLAIFSYISRKKTTPNLRNLTVLSSITDKITRISNHFGDRWRHEYVVNLHEIKRETNTILKRPINKLFTIENTFHDTNQTDKSREQNLW